mmetsp:Transcript_29959/g.75380  ORF Transcript_29959/g.75380 Transcript_29959/m.75380 type:complete len:297 (+) Transcript_29959:207-1097(+)
MCAKTDTWFDALVASAQPTGEELQTAKERYEAVRAILHKEPWVKKAVVAGSFARMTASHPINDVDVFVEIDGLDAAEDFENFKKRVCLTMSQAKSELGFDDIRRQTHSLGILWPSGPSVDLVPLNVNEDGTFQIIKSTLGGWLATFPTDASSTLNEANEACGGQLIPLIRLLKSWNNSWKKNDHDTKPLKSFHLEVMCYSVDPSGFVKQKTSLSRFMYLLLHLSTKVVCSSLTPPRDGSPLPAYFNDGHPWKPIDVSDFLKDGAKLTLSAEKSTACQTKLMQWLASPRSYYESLKE